MAIKKVKLNFSSRDTLDSHQTYRSSDIELQSESQLINYLLTEKEGERNNKLIMREQVLFTRLKTLGCQRDLENGCTTIRHEFFAMSIRSEERKTFLFLREKILFLIIHQREGSSGWER
jgi:hypothetical protein